MPGRTLDKATYLARRETDARDCTITEAMPVIERPLKSSTQWRQLS